MELNSSVDPRTFSVMVGRFPHPPHEWIGPVQFAARQRSTTTVKRILYLTILMYGVGIARDVTYDKETGIKVGI